MLQYIDLDLPVLMDLLVKHTNEYTNMLTFSSYTVEEFAQCKRTLAEIQQAIKIKIEQEGYLLNSVVPNISDYTVNPGEKPSLGNPKDSQEQQQQQ